MRTTTRTDLSRYVRPDPLARIERREATRRVLRAAHRIALAIVVALLLPVPCAILAAAAGLIPVELSAAIFAAWFGAGDGFPWGALLMVAFFGVYAPLECAVSARGA